MPITLTKPRMRPTSIVLAIDTIVELRRTALKLALRTNEPVTTSSLVRGIVENYLSDRKCKLLGDPVPV